MKKFFLSLVLSIASLSTYSTVVHADHISKLYDEDKTINISVSSSKIYTDSKLKKVKLTAKKDKVYKVDGYRNIRGKKYYRIYQDKYVGYILASHTKAVSFKKVDHDVKAIKDYHLWGNLYFSSKKGTLRPGRVYEARGYYQLASGKKYYSLEDEHHDRWIGYVNQDAIRYYDDDQEDISKLYQQSQLINISTSSTKIYTDSTLKKVKLTAKKDKVYKVDGYRNIRGKKYYRIYQDKYVGYVLASHTKAVSFKKVDHDVKAIKDYHLWGNLYFSSKKGTLRPGRVYEARGYYQLASGKKYYSLESEHNDRWIGYVNQDAIRYYDDDYDDWDEDDD